MSTFLIVENDNAIQYTRTIQRNSNVHDHIEAVPVCRPVEEKIIDDVDQRSKVHDTTVFPHNSIAKLVMHFLEDGKLKRYVGTGFLTSNNVFMTAGHNIYDKKLKIYASSVDLYFGINHNLGDPISLNGPILNNFEFGNGYITGPYSDTGNDICWIDLQKYLPTNALNQLPKECFVIDPSKTFDNGEHFIISGNTL